MSPGMVGARDVTGVVGLNPGLIEVEIPAINKNLTESIVDFAVP